MSAYCTVEDLLGLILDFGPSSLDDLRRRVHDLPQLGGREFNPSRVRQQLTGLIDYGVLRLADDRYAPGPGLGTALVIYLGRTDIYTGLYDAGQRPLATSRSSYESEIRFEGRLDRVLERAVTQMSVLLSGVKWDRVGLPAAIAVGLPAPVDLHERRVIDGPWQRFQNLHSMLEVAWEHRGVGLPPLPRTRSGGRERLSLSIDTDVVFDTLAAMYAPAAGVGRGVAPQVGAHHPAQARVVLGVKCSAGVRSTLVHRGPQDLWASESRERGLRKAGQRRDSVFRGAYGDTVGLGHSIALIHRASGDERVGYDLVSDWTEARHQVTCSCGTRDVPHLELFTSYDGIARRLGTTPDAVPSVHQAVDRAARPSDREQAQRWDQVLRETGRLLGLAIDTGISLYDPEAVLVTGGIVYGDTVWEELQDTATRASSPRRCLMRASDLPGDDENNPIGLRGGARLAFDTWVYPSFVGKRGTATNRARA